MRLLSLVIAACTCIHAQGSPPVSLRPGGGGFSTVPQVLVLPRLAFRATRLVVGSSWRGAILALCRVELAAEQFLCSGLTRGGALKHLGMWRV